MLKIFQARLQQYMNCEFPVVQAGFRKGRGTRDQIANNCWHRKSKKSLKKQESSRKTSVSALLTMPKPLTEWITINWKILSKAFSASIEILSTVYNGQDMETN